VYDALGRRTLMTTLDGEWSYKYDAIDQLTGATFTSTNPDIPSQNLIYEYDAAGNRVRTFADGVPTDYGVNDRNQYTLVGARTYTYDADGNLVVTSEGPDQTTYVYDDESRLISVTTPAETWTYEYNALGQRVATVHNGERTEYLLEPTGLTDVIAEYDAAGNLIVHYAHGLGLEARVHGGAAAYYQFDALGSTVGLIGADGANLNEYHYDPFGGLLVPATETIANPFGFVGELGVMMEGNGLHFMRARYYSPDDGRFINEDPIGHAGGINLYL
jgi:RHS repeat-associated protein